MPALCPERPADKNDVGNHFSHTFLPIDPFLSGQSFRSSPGRNRIVDYGECDAPHYLGAPLVSERRESDYVNVMLLERLVLLKPVQAKQ